MSALSGVSPILTLTGTNKAKVQQLIDIIANPDAATGGSGAVAGGPNGTLNTYLDEMSPGAAAQLRVELIALKASIADV
jgi:hypothetical protein